MIAFCCRKSKKYQEEKYHWPNRSDSSTSNSNLQSQNDEGKSSVSKKAQKSTTKALISTTKSGYLSSSGPKDFMKKRYSSEILQVGYSSLILAYCVDGKNGVFIQCQQPVFAWVLSFFEMAKRAWWCTTCTLSLSGLWPLLFALLSRHPNNKHNLHCRKLSRE